MPEKLYGDSLPEPQETVRKLQAFIIERMVDPATTVMAAVGEPGDDVMHDAQVSVATGELRVLREISDWLQSHDS